VKSTNSFQNTHSKKIEQKIVFMQVAGTMNVITNQHKKRLLTTSAGRLYTPFSNQKLPAVPTFQ
jgi:hypothetical protein